MTLSLKHKFASLIPDAGDPTIVQPSNWNDEHALTQATSTILGRVSALTGPTEELSPAQARTLLNVADGATANSSDAFLLARANHTGTQSADTLTDGTTNKAFLATERTKLAGIATGATANSTDAFLLARANHTGTQSADTLTDGTTNKAFLATERTKLAGIATGATANSSDATLLARANHTGTQLAATISDFSTAADLRVASATATFTNKTFDTAGSGNSLSINGVAVTANTGTGAVARASSPTFTTGITVPLVIGGNGAGSSLSLQSTSGVGATDFINFLVGNAGATEAARFTTSGQLGIGTTAPTSKLTVSLNTAALPAPPVGTMLHVGNVDGQSTRIAVDSFGTSISSNLTFRRSRGTAALPTAVQTDDQILNVASFGYGATGYSNATRAGFIAFAAENWTDLAQGTYFTVSTTPIGGAASVEGVRLAPDSSIMHRANAQKIFDANSFLGLRQYAAGSLPSQASGFFIESSDILAGILGSDGAQWISPGVKVLNAVTANTTVSIPAGWAIEGIFFANTTANVVTGGVKIGTTSGAVDVVAAQAIGANAIGHVTDATTLKRLFSRTAAQTLFIQTVTAWNSASVEFSFALRKVF